MAVAALAPARSAGVAAPLLCARCCGETMSYGRLAVTRCPDGRWLLRLETGRKGGAWLELLPADAAWLAGVLAHRKEVGNEI